MTTTYLNTELVFCRLPQWNLWNTIRILQTTLAFAAMKVRAELKWSILNQHTKPSVVAAEMMLQHPLHVTEQLLAEIMKIWNEQYVVWNGNMLLKQAALAPLISLIYDNGSETDRMLIFSSNIGLRILTEGDSWFMDGTYDTAPSQFSQLYVIRSAVSDPYVTMFATPSFHPNNRMYMRRCCPPCLIHVC